MLPWYGVARRRGAAGAVAVLTRSGRLALAATRIGIASLPQRWGASSVIVVGIAGVVGVLVAMLAMGEGFSATLKQTGSDDTAIILRGGSQAETNSVITRDQVPLIATLAGIAQGRRRPRDHLAGAVAGGQPADASRRRATRTCSSAASARRPGRSVRKLKIVEGRKFGAGLRELVVGQGAQTQFRGLEVGKQLKLGNQSWTVVGVFASGDCA